MSLTTQIRLLGLLTLLLCALSAACFAAALGIL